MVYWLESDTFATDEVWEAMSLGNGDLEDRLQAAYCRLKATASHVLSNGYLMERKALELCRGRRRVLELLCSRPIDGRQPLLHRKGDVCECLGEDWSEPYAYRIHGFLKRNPARAEVERNKAMKADRKDARLRALVYERDGGCCRYCRSGPLPPNAGRSKDRRKVRSFDHVNPDQAAGPNGEGYVLACDRCNTEKGARLPEEADMVLLDEPTDAEKAAWAARGLALFDRAEIAPETRRDRVSDRDPEANADRDPGAIPDDDGMGDVHPNHAEDGSRPLPTRSENRAGSGRVAADSDPVLQVPLRKPTQDQPVRTSAEPDIYTGRSRASPPDPPPKSRYHGWPPGSTAAEPRRKHQDPDSSDGRPPWT